MVNNPIDIKTLTLEELSGVVSVYPWFSAARLEFCSRMSRMGEAWSQEQYAAYALYVPSRKLVARLAARLAVSDFSDREVKDYIHEETVSQKNQVYVVGGDFFSRDQYETVRKADDNIFSSFASKEHTFTQESREKVEYPDYCTETLALVYIEQGYPQEAKEIYSKLSLRYPEKSAYFADLIAKIEENI